MKLCQYQIFKISILKVKHNRKLRVRFIYFDMIISVHNTNYALNIYIILAKSQTTLKKSLIFHKQCANITVLDKNGLKCNIYLIRYRSVTIYDICQFTVNQNNLKRYHCNSFSSVLFF